MGLLDFLGVCAVLVQAHAILAFYRCLECLSTCYEFGPVYLIVFIALLAIAFIAAATLFSVCMLRMLNYIFITIPLSAIAGLFAVVHDTAPNEQVAVNPSPNGGGSAHAPIAIFVFIAILAYLELQTLDNCYAFLDVNPLAILALLGPILIAVIVIAASAILMCGSFDILSFFFLTLLSWALFPVKTALGLSPKSNGLARAPVNTTSNFMVSCDFPPHLDQLLKSKCYVHISINAPTEASFRSTPIFHILSLPDMQTAHQSPKGNDLPHDLANATTQTITEPEILLNMQLKGDDRTQLLKGNGQVPVSTNAPTAIHIIADIKPVLSQSRPRVSANTVSGTQTVAKTIPISSRAPLPVSAKMTTTTVQTVPRPNRFPFNTKLRSMSEDSKKDTARPGRLLSSTQFSRRF